MKPDWKMLAGLPRNKVVEITGAQPDDPHLDELMSFLQALANDVTTDELFAQFPTWTLSLLEAEVERNRRLLGNA